VSRCPSKAFTPELWSLARLVSAVRSTGMPMTGGGVDTADAWTVEAFGLLNAELDRISAKQAEKRAEVMRQRMGGRRV